MGWISGWSHRKTVTITGQAGAGTDYQVNLSIGDASGGDFHLENHCTSFPNDITVTDNDQTTLLDHWVEDLTVDPISMWVEVADSLNSNADVCVYYRKSGESSARNIDNTFSFGDDFPGTSLDGSKWDSSGTIGVLNSICDISSDAADSQIYKSGVTLSLPLAVRVKAKTGAGYVSDICGLYATNNYFIVRRIDTSTPTYYQLITKAAGSYSYVSTTFAFDSSYHVWDVRWKSGEIKIYRDGSLGVTKTTNIPSVTLTQRMVRANDEQAAAETWVDWYIIRKYTDPEPAFSSAGIEESAGGRLVYGGLVNAGLVGGRLV